MDRRHRQTLHRQPEDWAALSKGLLKAELVRRGIGYQQLAERLELLGVTYTTENLTNKVNRGKFSTMFLLQCLEAIDCKVLRISDE
jgi:hypothetical protein